MALIKCKDCGHDISSEAPTCPHCGRLTSKSFWGPRRAGGPYAASGCLIVFIGIGISIFTASTYPLWTSVIIFIVLVFRALYVVDNMDEPKK